METRIGFRRVPEPGRPDTRLRQLSTAGATGALTVTGEPGGVIFLVGGLVHAVESPAAPGVGQLLIGRGRVTRHEWDAARLADGPLGAALVDAGRLTRGELELCALDALYDAAYFVLGTDPAHVHFTTGVTCRWGTGIGVDAEELRAGRDRQRHLLHEVHPCDDNDGAPVLPVRRPGLDRVFLSGLQWEIILHADGRRTPIDLAHLLGRPAFAVVLDVRRLVSTGLVERGPERKRPDPRQGQVSAAAPADTPHHVVDRPTAGIVDADEPAAPSSTGRKRARPPALPRRVPGGSIPDVVGATTDADPRTPATVTALATLPGMNGLSCEESILRRIRNALQAMR